MLPNALDGIGLGGMGRLEHQNDVCRNLQPLSFVCSGLIQLNDRRAVVVVLTHQVQEHLETIAVEVGELIEEMCSSCQFYTPYR